MICIKIIRHIRWLFSSKYFRWVETTNREM